MKKDVTLKPRSDNDTKNVDKKKSAKPKKKLEVSEKKLESIGLSIRNVKEDELKAYKVDNGIMITNVDRFSKAESQRLARGVVIVEADRKAITSVSDLVEIVDAKKGSSLLLKVAYQDGTTRLVGLEVKK